jgi:hypothetical protein
MYILDTNILSELMRPRPEPLVMSWLNGQAPQDMATSAICAAEIEAGIAYLPNGRRKRDLELDWQDLRRDLLLAGVFAFDERAAPIYGRFRDMRRRGGASIDELDLLTAAIAADLGATVVTRNTPDFEGLVAFFNPWTEQLSP